MGMSCVFVLGGMEGVQRLLGEEYKHVLHTFEHACAASNARWGCAQGFLGTAVIKAFVGRVFKGMAQQQVECSMMSCSS
jgi:hypothetical protein